MKNYVNPLRQVNEDEPIYFLPPYKVEIAYVSMSQTIDWGLEMLGIPNLWRTTKGKGINIAVLDTGIASNHPELKDAILDMKDFTNSPSGPIDINGHGTHCAGIIAANDNSAGVVGVAPEAKLLIGKVLGDNGGGTSKSVANGIKWAVEKGANIISLSLGSPYPSEDIYEVIKAAIEKKVFIICAAGNSGPSLDTVDYPAKFDDVISVGSIDRSKKVSIFSSRGAEVDIVAPGDKILSTYPPQLYATLSGTSMATPFVAGVAALAISKHNLYGGATPIETQKDLIKHLTATAIDLGPIGFDYSYGFGLINPKQLLEKVDFRNNLITTLLQPKA